MRSLPVGQWVLSLPHRLRYLLAWDHELCRAVTGVALRTVLGFLRRRARRDGVVDGRSGAVVIIQRFGGAVNLNVTSTRSCWTGCSRWTEDQAPRARPPTPPPPPRGSLERLPRAPLVLFTTAFDECAVRAFEVNAFDYLLKPIRPERLAGCPGKSAKALTLRTETPPRGSRPSPERVFVRDGDRCWIVALGDIALFEGEGNYTRLYFDAHRPLIRSSLATLEARLDPAVFFRASRRHIVNLRMIEKVEATGDDVYTVRLRNGCQVAVSRRQSKRLRDTLSL